MCLLAYLFSFFGPIYRPEESFSRLPGTHRGCCVPQKRLWTKVETFVPPQGQLWASTLSEGQVSCVKLWQSPSWSTIIRAPALEPRAASAPESPPPAGTQPSFVVHLHVCVSLSEQHFGKSESKTPTSVNLHKPSLQVPPPLFLPCVWFRFKKNIKAFTNLFRNNWNETMECQLGVWHTSPQVWTPPDSRRKEALTPWNQTGAEWNFYQQERKRKILPTAADTTDIWTVRTAAVM